MLMSDTLEKGSGENDRVAVEELNEDRFTLRTRRRNLIYNFGRHAEGCE